MFKYTIFHQKPTIPPPLFICPTKKNKHKSGTKQTCNFETYLLLCALVFSLHLSQGVRSRGTGVRIVMSCHMGRVLDEQQCSNHWAKPPNFKSPFLSSASPGNPTQMQSFLSSLEDCIQKCVLPWNLVRKSRGTEDELEGICTRAYSKSQHHHVEGRTWWAAGSPRETNALG